MSRSDEQDGSPAFVTTHWTRVLQARGDSTEARAALSDLCAAYYAPVFAFIRRHASDEDRARELTQEFFRRLLEKNTISKVDPAYGKFRSYLLGAVIHFLADVRKHAEREKRGGNKPHESLSRQGSESNTTATRELADIKAPNPEHEFDRKWALTVLSRALEALAAERQQAGAGTQFELLKIWLLGDTEGISQAETARALGMNEGAVKVAIHRLRKQFRQQIRNEIAQTVKEPDSVEEEMRSLMSALG